MKIASSSLKILIGDADELSSRDLSTKITRMGHTVVAVKHTTDDILGEAIVLKPDLVVMNMKLTGSMDAVAAAWRIYDEIDAPTIYIVGAADAKLKVKMVEKYYYGSVNKPIDDNELFEALKKADIKHMQDIFDKQRVRK